MGTDLSLLRWFLQRLTGLGLAFFLSVHIITQHFTVMDVVNFHNVVNRIQSSILWLIFYFLFLVFILWHGLNGVYEIVNDYTPSRGLRLFIGWGCWLIGLAASGWGCYVLINWWLCK